MTARSRLTTSLATLLVMGGAGGLFWWGAQAAADFIETRSTEEVRAALAAAGQDWVEVRADGLEVRLTGTAPSEVERFRAMSQAATAVDATRVLDRMTVAATEAMTPPEFKVELLRNDAGISVIGLVPASTDRVALMRQLRTETAAPQITDLMESADYPVPEGWTEALNYGVAAVQASAQSKISIQPGRVQVTALAGSAAEKARLETRLQEARPEGLALQAEISAPRPVVSPFLLQAVMDARGMRIETCAADDEDAREKILAAAEAAGVADSPACTLALGAPSGDWGDAASLAISALAELGAGRLTISDADVALLVPATLDRGALNRVTQSLDAALPRVFALTAEQEQAEDAPRGPVEFVATLSETGSLTLRGGIADTRMREAVDSFANSRFEVARSTLRPSPDVPGGWTVRMIAGLEALGVLASGSVQVTPELITLSGTSGDPDAPRTAAALLSQRLEPGLPFELAIRYDRLLDEGLGLPDGEECVARLNLIMSESEIGFEPSRSSIAGDPAPTLRGLGTAMEDCAEFQIEAGGHTDSQGSEGFNADLSRSRAQAIVSAMAEAGIDVGNMTSRGYGESQPIATNETEEGREANRRIEFRLMSPHRVRSAPLPEPVVVTGVTGADPAPEAEAPAPAVAAGGFGPERPQVQGPVLPGPAPQMQGPVLPAARELSLAPRTLGASEEFQTLDEREESIRLPVLTPTPETPRPSARPAGVGAQDEDPTAE